MNRKKSLTLVEIMIVVAIIAVLAGISIPNLLRNRVTAQESAATASIHTIVAAEVQWRATHPQYADLDELDDSSPKYISSTLAGGTKQGYDFAATPVPGSEATQFYATAAPEVLTHGHTFYINESGFLCRSDDVGVAAPAGYTQGCPANFSLME